jgi:Flp pilus assembly protein TadD
MGLKFRHNLVVSASRIVLIAATTALSGCSGTGFFTSSDPTSTHNLVVPEQQDLVGGAAYWGAKYDSNHDDIPAAVAFARNLRMMGGAQQAVTLMKDVVTKAPGDAGVLSEYGKALTAVGRSSDALPFFMRAIQVNNQDWTTFSAYGVALDQSGDHKGAQANYKAALELSPSNPAIESNLAMSYVLTGQIVEGEAILRRLVARPDATPQMRQNLAMVASIKGNKAEAETLAKQDLSPADAFNNMAVLKQLSPPAPKPVAPGSTTAPETPAPAAQQSSSAAPAIAAPRKPIEANITLPPLERPADLSVLPPPVHGKDTADASTSLADPADTMLIAPPKAAPAPASKTATPATHKPPVKMDPIADDGDAKPAAPAATAPARPIVPPKPANTQASLSAPGALRRTLTSDDQDKLEIEMANAGF